MIRLTLASALIMSASFSSAAIFGEDDRVAITANSPGAELARSTAVAILSSNFEQASASTLKFSSDSIGDFVCASERFSKDPSFSYACTGFLVAPDLLVTAGHCAVNVGESRNESGSYCEAFSWLFDYQMGVGGQKPAMLRSSRDLYRCKQIIYAVREEHASFRDYALIQLDRPVTDRKPLSLARTAAVLRPLSMIGYPLGTPAKLSRNGRVLRDDPSRESFMTNLDAFEGNSGSPVFNNDNQVIGILTGGTPNESLITKEGETCRRYNRCDEDGLNCTQDNGAAAKLDGYQGPGAEVQRIAPLLKLIEDFERARQ